MATTIIERGSAVPISKEMLEILCCPVTKVPVVMLPEDKLRRVNELIKSQAIHSVEGELIEVPLAEAIITENNQTIYRIDDDIPVMLIGSGIPVDQIDNF